MKFFLNIALYNTHIPLICYSNSKIKRLSYKIAIKYLGKYLRKDCFYHSVPNCLPKATFFDSRLRF